MRFIVERLLGKEDDALSAQTRRLNRNERAAFRILSTVVDECFKIRTDEVVSRVGGTTWQMIEDTTWNGGGITPNGDLSIVKDKPAES